MCLAVPAKIISKKGAMAQVDVAGNQISADISMVDDAAVGEYVLVHAGLAIQKYDREEALKTLELLREFADKSGHS